MADRYIPEHRRTNFKAKGTFKPDELRRRREEQQVEIRKAKREENLAKRRGIGTGENRPGASLGAAPDSDDDTAPTESQVSPSKLLLFFGCLSQSLRRKTFSPFTPPAFPKLVAPAKSHRAICFRCQATFALAPHRGQIVVRVFIRTTVTTVYWDACNGGSCVRRASIRHHLRC